MFFLQVSASVDLLDSLTSVAGVEADAIKAWLEAGAVTGLEDGAVEVEVLGGIREVVGVEEGGIRLEVAEGAVRRERQPLLHYIAAHHVMAVLGQEDEELGQVKNFVQQQFQKHPHLEALFRQES